MRVGIDAHALGTKAGGNETYMRELLRALGAHAPDSDIVALVGGSLDSDDAVPGSFPTCRLPTDSSALRILYGLSRTARRAALDLLHVQYNAPLYCPCPMVVSIHDIVWKRHPELLRPVDRFRLAWLTPGTLRRAARVFVLTEAMKREIAETYRIPLERFDLVQPPPDPVFRPVRDEEELRRARDRYGLPSDFILYVGALQPRKNLVRLATAFSRLVERGLPHRLAIAGKRAWLCGPMLDAINDLQLGDRLVFTGYVEQADLPRLISAAAAFAYVSVYEGFGLPVLEALACGAPVLASSDPAIREVAGDAALMCQATDTEAIGDGLIRILSDSELRTRLREAGPRRAQAFSHDRMARSALAGYERATG